MVARLFDGCARAVRHHDFAHHQHAVYARGVRIDGDGLEHAIRVVAFRLHGRTAVKTPQRQLLERRKRVELLELSLATQVRRRRVTVEPDVFEFVFCHSRLSCAEVRSAEVRYLCAETRAAANRGRIESIRAASRPLSSILCANRRLGRTALPRSGESPALRGRIAARRMSKSGNAHIVAMR